MTVFLRQRPIVGLLCLVFFNLFLVSVQVRSPEGTLMLRAIGLAVYTPPAAFAAYIANGVAATGRRFLELQVIADRNQALETELGRLKLEVKRLQSVQRMVERSRELAHLQEVYQFETVVGAVIWRNIPAFTERLIINVGEREGVREDAPVLTPDGVVGRILTTTFTSAEVELLTDSRAAAGAILESSRLEGVVQGQGGDMLRLNFISSAEQVQIGEAVLTSGFDRIYPKGLPIGIVEACDKAGTYQVIDVRPKVDFRKLEEVAVVVNRP